MTNLSAPQPSASRSCRIMLIDDHQSVRQGLRALFESVPGIDVVHEAADGQSALDAVRTVAPDLLVIDLSMPRVDGLTVMRQLRYTRSQTRIVVLSRYREAGYVREAFAAGATAYVLKQSPFAELHRAVDSAMRGQKYVDAALVANVPAESPYGDAPAVTDREFDVLRRSTLGHSNKVVGDALEIAVKTVEAHKANAMKKLGLGSRQELIRYAALHRWFDDA